MYILNVFSILDDSFNHMYIFNFFNFLEINEFQLFTSVLTDCYAYLSTIQLPFIAEWYNSVFSVTFNSAAYVIHPELLFFKANLFNLVYNYYLSAFYISGYSPIVNDTLDLVVFSILHYCVVLFVVSLIFILYFSPYTNLTQELNVDIDYSSTSLLIEAEKEISSIDDIILFAVCVFYIFGWFFYLNVFSFLLTNTYTASILILLPVFFFTIVGVPTFLIYDFGLYFLVYLRGAGTTSLFLFELMYDYIAVMVFYTRIIVQNIRLLLMFFTVISLYDVFIFFSLSTQNLFKDLTLEGFFNADYFTNENTSYGFIFLFINKVLMLIYEILHTYFIVMVQFIAFFAIVF